MPQILEVIRTKPNAALSKFEAARSIEKDGLGCRFEQDLWNDLPTIY